MSKLFDDGATSELAAETDESGETQYSAEVTEASAASGPPRCTDDAYNLLTFDRNGIERAAKWFGTMNYRIRESTIPSDMNISATISALRKGPQRITSGFNDCGRTPSISAEANYAGDTSRPADITANDEFCATVAQADNVSVHTFGDISGGTLAVACEYVVFNGTPRHRIVAADVRFDGSNRNWWIPGHNSCPAGGFSLPAVSVHETGHTFGLGHVSENNHGYLTMSTGIAPCNDSASSLGLGDIRGLTDLY